MFVVKRGAGKHSQPTDDLRILYLKKIAVKVYHLPFCRKSFEERLIL
jgi:hypothetical protein